MKPIARIVALLLLAAAPLYANIISTPNHFGSTADRTTYVPCDNTHNGWYYGIYDLASGTCASPVGGGSGYLGCVCYGATGTWTAAGASGAGSGTVTSVGTTVPAGFSVSGSPVTTSGTLAISYASGQTSHRVLGTCGSATTLSVCALGLTDLPTDWALATQTVTGAGTASKCARFDASHHLTEDTADCSSYGIPTPETPPTTPNAFNDEFDAGSSIDTAGTRFSGAIAWSWVNQGGATADITRGRLVLTAPASSSDNLRMVCEPLSGATTAKFRMKSFAESSYTAFYNGGMAFRNSSTGKMLGLLNGYNGSGLLFQFININSVTSFSTAVAFLNGTHRPYIELELTATQIIARYSEGGGVDGAFVTFGTANLSSFVTSVDQFCLFSNSNNGSTAPAVLVVDWLRRADDAGYNTLPY